MVEMAMRDILPAVNAYAAEVAKGAADKTSVVPTANISMETDLIERLSELSAKAYLAAKELKAADALAMAKADSEKRATAFAERVIPIMDKLRRLVDEMETMTSAKWWPVPNYGDMMFRV